MRPQKREYFPFSDAVYNAEARVLQARVDTRKKKGLVVTSDELWGWIKERKPSWEELDRERVWRRVKL